jgi:hypothetical protein
MMKRTGLAALAAALLLAPGAEAKLIATFGERYAEPGDRVPVELGVEAERFLTSLRVYLVPIEAAGTTKGQSDPHQRKVAEFRGRAAGAVPSTFDFAVPPLPPGLYASEIWFRGIQTGWQELAGRHPRLTIRPPAPSESGPSYTPALLGVVPLALAAGLVLWRRQR